MAIVVSKPMHEPKFVYMQKVRVVKSVYRGQVGIVKGAFVRGWFNRRWVYLFEGEQSSYLKLKLEESYLEEADAD